MRDADVIFEWRTHPLGDDPRRALLFCLALAVTLAIVWWSFRHLGWTLFAALLLSGSLYRFWLPMHYRLSETELESRQGFLRVTRRLADFRRVELEARGAFLSPYAEPNRLEQYRGVYLPYPADSEPLKRFLRHKFPGAEPGGDSEAS
jgi:hypothetical protein